jgi:hydroxyethylthiazole kinase-like uncharacterized protein yjeF
MPIPVISVSQMREWEAATWAGRQTEAAVIARVGEFVARRVTELTREGERVIVLAGKGHNGDDARAMAGHLGAREVVFIDASDPVLAVARFSQEVEKGAPALIVDGLFGIGLNRPLNHDWLTLIARVNHAHAPVLAIDVPSGLNADTGDVSTAAIQAAETLTVGAVKRGMLLGDAPSYVGKVNVLSEVGLVPCPCVSDVQWTTEKDFKNFPPPRGVGTHKGSFGHLAIVAGSRGFHGAAVLASRGAQRARPGLITLFAQPEIYVPVASQTQSVMVATWDAAQDWQRFSALLFGPGLAAPDLPESVHDAVRVAWEQFDGAVVVDASALAWVPEKRGPMNRVRVITPHPGEAARMLGVSTPDVQRDRLSATRALSKKFGECWVILKGHQTVVGRATGNLFVNCSGSPGLAQGGSGDLLAGYIAGWLAQPVACIDPEMLLRHAVWEHGAAGDRLDAARGTWTVEELAGELGARR